MSYRNGISFRSLASITIMGHLTPSTKKSKARTEDPLLSRFGLMWRLFDEVGKWNRNMVTLNAFHLTILLASISV
jgi:hypothetical protein